MNFAKSQVFFHKNTLNEVSTKISDELGILITLDLDSYLVSQIDNSLKHKPLRPNKLCSKPLACLLVSLQNA